MAADERSALYGPPAGAMLEMYVVDKSKMVNSCRAAGRLERREPPSRRTLYWPVAVGAGVLHSIAVSLVTLAAVLLKTGVPTSELAKPHNKGAAPATSAKTAASMAEARAAKPKPVSLSVDEQPSAVPLGSTESTWSTMSLTAG